MGMKRAALIGALTIALCLAACAPKSDMPGNTDAPPRQETGEFVLPDDIRVNSAGVPELRVYVADEKEIREMDLEEYAGAGDPCTHLRDPLHHRKTE